MTDRSEVLDLDNIEGVQELKWSVDGVAIGETLRVSYETPRSDSEQVRVGTVTDIGEVTRDHGAPTGTPEVRLEGADGDHLIVWPAWEAIRTHAAGRLGTIVDVELAARPDGGGVEATRVEAPGDPVTIDIELRRNASGAVLDYADRARAKDRLERAMPALRELYRLIDRTVGSDGTQVAQVVLHPETGEPMHLRFDHANARDLQPSEVDDIVATVLAHSRGEDSDSAGGAA